MKPTSLSRLPRTVTVLAAALCLAAAAPAMANLVALPAATFGGSGIPNAAVEVATFHPTYGGSLTLGLTAHQRYANPALANDGVDTFFALPGGDLLNGVPSYARWNFAFYIGFDPTQGGAEAWYGFGNTVSLYWDLNPAVGNPASSGGVVPLAYYREGVFQNSWNLGMGFLGGGFNPAATGEYSFALVAKDSAGGELARSSITVVVGSPSPVPDSSSTVLLLGSALVGLGCCLRRIRI